MRLFPVIGCVLLGVTAAAAQDRRISVRVEHPSGATIPNAHIIVLAGSDVIAEQAFGACGGQRGPGARGQERRFEMYLFVQNVFNRVNRSSWVGVRTSPLFGQPTSAQAARRVELGWRFAF